ncbi:hypothetical protein [Comamonas jiangduensis]|uniref:hypothetical protein n=1 Tax=Comamonas jiangduensis TaxID=1194168 RepID=UPI003BF79093
MSASTRQVYRINHSYIRGVARNNDMKKRAIALERLIKDRAFWHGDKFSKPASLGARMALVVLGDKSMDCLQYIQQHSAEFATGDCAKALSRWRFATYSMYRSGRLPG